MGEFRLMAMSLAALLAVVSARGQEGHAPGNAASEPREGRAFGVGVALGMGRMGVAGNSSSTFAAGAIARLGLDSRNRFQLIAEIQPTEVASPILDESFSSANLAVGYGFGKSVTVRPIVGVQYRWWSGSERVTASEWGPLLGLDAGPELRVSDTLSVSPELVLRLSLIEVEGNVSSTFVGVQCVFSWRPAR